MSTDLYYSCSQLYTKEKDKKKCKARQDLFYDLFYDKDLQNFIINDNNDEKINPDKDEWDSQTFQKNKKYCIKIPTNTTHSLNVMPRTTYNNNLTAIVFNIVQEYTQEESEFIYKAINNPDCSNPKYCQDAIGNNIIFDENGNLKLRVPNDDSVSSSDFQEKVILNKKLKNDNLKDISSKNFFSDSLYSKSNAYRYIGNDIWGLCKKFFMSTSGRYIIYTPLKKDELIKKQPPPAIVYYLLKNPIHTKEFDKFYRLLTEANSPNNDPSGDDRTIFTDENNGGYLRSETTIIYQNDAATIKRGFAIPSYVDIMGKYCNAFKFNSNPLPNGLASEIYLDPVCSMALDITGGEICFYLGKNFTHECLSYDYWREPNSATEPEMNSDSIKAQGVLRQQTGITTGMQDERAPQWPCENHTQSGLITVLDFLRTVQRSLQISSDSFIITLAHSYLAKYGHGHLEGQANRINWDVTLADADNNIDPPSCDALPSTNINLCTNIIEVSGSVTNSDFSKLQNACGGTTYNIYNGELENPDEDVDEGSGEDEEEGEGEDSVDGELEPGLGSPGYLCGETGITPSDLRVIFAESGETQDDISIALKAMKVDGDGCIDEDELYIHGFKRDGGNIVPVEPGELEPGLGSPGYLCGETGITPSDLRVIFAELQWTQADISSVLTIMKTDGDGCIDEDELFNLGFKRDGLDIVPVDNNPEGPSVDNTLLTRYQEEMIRVWIEQATFFNNREELTEEAKQRIRDGILTGERVYTDDETARDQFFADMNGITLEESRQFWYKKNIRVRTDRKFTDSELITIRRLLGEYYEEGPVPKVPPVDNNPEGPPIENGGETGLGSPNYRCGEKGITPSDLSVIFYYRSADFAASPEYLSNVLKAMNIDGDGCIDEDELYGWELKRDGSDIVSIYGASGGKPPVDNNPEGPPVDNNPEGPPIENVKNSSLGILFIPLIIILIIVGAVFLYFK